MRSRVYVFLILSGILCFTVQAKAEVHANAHLNNSGFNANTPINFGIIFLGLAGIVFGVCAVKTSKPSIDIVSIKI